MSYTRAEAKLGELPEGRDSAEGFSTSARRFKHPPAVVLTMLPVVPLIGCGHPSSQDGKLTASLEFGMKVSPARYGGGMDTMTLINIDTTTLFIIIAVLILVGAGSFYGWGRWF